MNLSEQTKLKLKAYLFFGIIGLLAIFFVIKPVVSNYIDLQKQDEIITNQDIKDFHKWEKKQEQQQYNNTEVKLD